MIKINVKLSGLVILLSLIFTACQEDKLDNLEPDKTLQINESQGVLISDDVLGELAKNLAAGMKDELVRDFIKDQSVLRFDGDYNFLLQGNVDKEVTTNVNGRSTPTIFGSILTGNGSGSSQRQASMDKSIKQILSQNPLLQIAVPQLNNFSAENWDTKMTIPLVAYLPENYDDS